MKVRQVAERSEAGVRLHVGEISPAGRDRFAERGQGVGDVLLPRGGLVGGEGVRIGLDGGGTQAVDARGIVELLRRGCAQFAQLRDGLNGIGGSTRLNRLRPTQLQQRGQHLHRLFQKRLPITQRRRGVPALLNRRLHNPDPLCDGGSRSAHYRSAVLSSGSGVASQTLTVWSELAEASRFPSGLNETLTTGPVCPFSVRSS